MKREKKNGRYEKRIQEMVETYFRKHPNKEFGLGDISKLLQRSKMKWTDQTCYLYASRACIWLGEKGTIKKMEKWGIPNAYMLNVIKCQYCTNEYIPQNNSESRSCKFCGPGTELWRRRVSKVSELLQLEEINKWVIGDIASAIPTEQGKRTRLYNEATNLQRFAKDICKIMGKQEEQWEDVYKVISKYSSVSKRFKSKTRIKMLSWTHHNTVLNVDNAKTWLKRAEDNAWSCRKLREELIQAGKIELPFSHYYTKFHKNADRFMSVLERELENIDDETRKKLRKLARQLLEMCSA